ADNRVKAILAASKVGITKRLAEPESGLLDTLRERRDSLKAASACISPSISKSGLPARSRANALRILAAQGEGDVPKLEWDSSAALGASPKRRTLLAASRVISAICSAVGSTLTWVSQKNSAPLGRISADSE